MQNIPAFIFSQITNLIISFNFSNKNKTAITPIFIGSWKYSCFQQKRRQEVPIFGFYREHGAEAYIPYAAQPESVVQNPKGGTFRPQKRRQEVPIFGFYRQFGAEAYIPYAAQSESAV